MTAPRQAGTPAAGRESEEGRGPTVFLHIGVPKSGTTYLQSRFEANHRRAAAQGLLWPGPSWGRHVAAARDLGRLPEGAVPERGGAWSKLAREALGWRGQSVLISMEWLAELSPHQVRTAVESLRPARVEVICTARDLLRSFVAQGQEMTKNYRTWTWAQLEEEVLGEKRGPAYRRFWQQQDVPRILERWLDVVPQDRVHLVTVPPAGSDPEVLWRRFCGVVGVDGAGFEQPTSANASLGVVSTTLMQRLNGVASRRKLSHGVYDRALRQAVAVDVLGPLRRQEDPIAVGEEVDRYLRRRSESMLAELEGLGVDLVGEWQDLVPGEPLRGRSPEDVTEAELLELCMEALVTLAMSKTGAVRGEGSLYAAPRRVLPRSAQELLPAVRRSARRVRGSVTQPRGGLGPTDVG